MSKLIIVGERLNSSRIRVLEALKKRDEEFILNEAKKQKEAGANYLDVNASMMIKGEIETLKWIIPLIQNGIDIPIAIDTADHIAMEAGLKIHKGRALVNSISMRTSGLDDIMSLIKRYNAQLVAMCIDEHGIPKTALGRVLVAMKILDKLIENGISLDDIFIDPIAEPIAIDASNGVVCLESIRMIKNHLHNIKTIAGISNVSFGMPKRQLLNQVFLSLAIFAELDAAILDPLDEHIMNVLVTTEALIGKDPLLKDYLKRIRK